MSKMDLRGLHLKCQDCGEKYPVSGMFAGCLKDSGALEVIYDYDKLGGILSRWKGRNGTWAFRELLPLPEDVEPISLIEGGTPLVRTRNRRAWPDLDQGRNPKSDRRT